MDLKNSTAVLKASEPLRIGDVLPESATEQLMEIKDLISTPHKWMKRGYCNSDLTVFCLGGAIGYTLDANDPYRGLLNLNHDSEMMKILNVCLKARGWVAMSHFNDYPETTHAEVMQLLDEAILHSRIPRPAQ